MRSYKLIFGSGVVAATGLVLLGLALSVFDFPRMAFVPPFLLTALLLFALSAYQWRVFCSMNILVDDLRKNNIEGFYLETDSGLLRPLCDAISDSTVQLTEQIDRQRRILTFRDTQLSQLQRQKQNIEAIIYSIREGVVVCDAQQRLILANDAARSILNISDRMFQLQNAEDVIGNHQFISLLKQAEENQANHTKNQLAIEIAEFKRTYDCIISRMVDSEGNFNGLVAVLHDITDEKEMSEMKSDFVSLVSHELKTPLASIRAYAEMLADGEVAETEDVERFCDIIQNQAKRLNHLIEDILKISIIESDLMRIVKRPISLSAIIHEAVSMVKNFADEKDISIRVETPTTFDFAFADKDLLHQVMINLLSNALKYSRRAGSVIVRACIDETSRTATVTVTDNGMGIAPEDLDKVFEKFYRTDTGKKYAEGTGLGLNLVRQIVEKFHEGRVFVSSTPSRGSTFGFELPLASREIADEFPVTQKT